MFSNFFSENRAVNEIMSKNMVEPEVSHDVTIWHIRVAQWTSKATCTHVRAHGHAPGHTYPRTHARTDV
jgi:hypothetical protein